MPEVKVETLSELQEQLQKRCLSRLRVEGDGELWIAVASIKVATGGTIQEAVEKLLAKL